MCDSSDFGLHILGEIDPGVQNRPGLSRIWRERRTVVAESQPSFDAARYKNAQREQWNKDGAAWRRWTPTLERWYGAATRQMLDLARVRPGQRILDIAAGAGEVRSGRCTRRVAGR
jgi:cyclopropane fatty-acyl-phospholipid synthase-like methyltransferase